MKPPVYRIIVSGERNDRMTLLGGIIVSAIDKTNLVENGSAQAAVCFHYRGNARIVLRKVFAAISGCKKDGIDTLHFGSAVAKIVKV